MIEKMLTCSSCKEEKPVSSFHRRPNRPRGYVYNCKKCASIKRHNHHVQNKERYNRMAKEYYESHKSEKREYYRKNGDGVKNHRARQAVNNAIRDGKLERAATKTCADCGKDAEQYHHESYEKSKYLDVVALCRSCHSNRHRKYKL